MERTASDDQHAGATTSRRPALNLMRDVSNLENKNDHTGEEQRGRSTTQPGTSLPTHSALRKTGYQPNIAASYAPRQRGAWLRLNGVSPSPPVDRLMLDRELPEVEKKEEEVEAKEDADAESKRMSLSKHRHVSFKEPEDASSVEASPAPVEQPLEAEGLAPEEDDEVPFDMDEDIEEDEPDGDEEDGSFVAVEMGDQTDGSPQTARSSSLPRQAGIAGSLTKTTASLSEKADKRGDAAASLSALLNDPSSFIGSLKSRNYGIGSLPIRSATDYATSLSSSTKDRVSLSDQAQRLRDLLALDAPSHRTTKLKRDKALASYLRDSSAGQDNEKDIADDELDSVAPVSALATSLPVAIGVPGFNKKEAYDFERKTSVPQRESMLVPRLQGNNRHRPSKPGQYSPLDRLPSLGEESESQPTSRAPSPSGVPGPVNTGTGDALAAGNDETDEMADQLRELNGKEDFIPPHVSHYPGPLAMNKN